MKATALSVPRVEEDLFNSVYTHYGRWDEWKKTKFCFLSRKEIFVVDFYKYYFLCRAAGRELDVELAPLPEQHVEVLMKALHKLHNFYEYYERWNKS